MINNSDLFRDGIPKLRIAIAFKTYLDNKMMMFTIVTIMKQKIPYSGNISMLLLTK